jgi:hypothetical protein
MKLISQTATPHTPLSYLSSALSTVTTLFMQDQSHLIHGCTYMVSLGERQITYWPVLFPGTVQY